MVKGKSQKNADLFIADDDSIQSIRLDSALKENYGDYGRYINYYRSFPDIRDGLKRSQRANLWGGWSVGNRPGKKMKSVRFVAEAMGRFHPHGDAGIYDALVGMTQSFKVNVPLFNSEGNFGSVSDPGSFAAMRYTNAGISDYGAIMVGLHPGSESKRAEADEGFLPQVMAVDEVWPETMPALAPNFLINGYKGVGVAIAGNLPSHNPSEILDLAHYMVDQPNPRISTVRKYLPGPDFASGCDIFTGKNGEDMDTYMDKGSGTFTMRAKWSVEKQGKNTYLMLTNFPPETPAAKVVERINLLSNPEDGKDRVLPRSVLAENDSAGGQLRIRVSCGDLDPEVLAHELLRRRVGMQSNFSVNTIATLGESAFLTSVPEAMNFWLDHRRSMIRGRAEVRKAKAEKRLNVVVAILKAIPIAEEIVKVVRDSKNDNDARDKMVAKWGFTEDQATEILKLSVSKLSRAGVAPLEAEKSKLEETIDFNRALIEDDAARDKQLKKEIRDVKKAIGAPRQSTIVDGPATMPKQQGALVEVAHDKGHIAFTSGNWVRWLKRTSIKRDLMDDYVARIVPADTGQKIVVVTSMGRGVLIPVDSIVGDGNYVNLKMHLVSRLKGDKMQPGEEIVMAGVVNGEPHDIVVGTTHGRAKRLSWDGYGTKAADKLFPVCSMDAAEKVVSASLVGSEEKDLRAVAITSEGYALSVPLSEMTPKKGGKAKVTGYINLGRGANAEVKFFGVSTCAEENRVLYWTGTDGIAHADIAEMPTGKIGTKGARFIRPGVVFSGAAIAHPKDSVVVVAGGESKESSLQDIASGVMLTSRKFTDLDGVSTTGAIIAHSLDR